MNLNDLKLGTIISYNDKSGTNYAVVIGISGYIDYERSFITKNAYSYIFIVAYKLVSIELSANLKDKENTLNARKQFVNSILTASMNEEFNPEKPIANVMQYSLNNLMTLGVNVVKHEDIKGYLLKKALVNANVKRYLNYDIVDIFKRKKEQLLPYVPDLTK